MDRDKLRKLLHEKLSKLTIREEKLLRDIVDDEDVTLHQLEKADHVLRTNPIYRLDVDLPHEDEEDCDSVNGGEAGAGEGKTHGVISYDVDDAGDGSSDSHVDEEEDNDLDVSIQFDDDEIETFLASLSPETNK